MALSVLVFATWFLTLSLSVHSVSEKELNCTVLVSEPWPVPYIFVPQESTIIITCTADGHGEQPFWSIDLANDSVSTQYQFITRQGLLNAHGVYELPPIETPAGIPHTLRLLISNTDVNNQTEILCTGQDKSIHTTLFVINGNPQLAFEVLESGEQFIISWIGSHSIVPVSMTTSGVYYNLSISYGSSRQDISLNESTYHFTAPEGAPPCEVYNFSVSTTYVGPTYSGAGRSVHTEALYLRNPFAAHEFWTEVNLLGELFLNITVEQKVCTLVTYTLEPSQDTINSLESNESIVNDTQTQNFSFSIIYATREGKSSYYLKFYFIKQLNDSEMDTKRDMNVALFCDLDDAHYLQCALMLNSAYSDVIMTVTGDENNSDFKGINSCNTRNAVNHEDKLNFTADELLNLKSVITQKFSINSTCPSHNVIITVKKHHIIIIIVVVLSLFGVVFISTLVVGTFRKIRRDKNNPRQHTSSVPSEYPAENGGQNDYQEVEEAQISLQPQEIVPIYDHVNLNSSHEVNLCNGDEAGYNTTQHVLQQTSTGHNRHENGGGNYAKLQTDENHYYHTLERDRDPCGIEVYVSTDSSTDHNASPLHSGGAI